MRYDKAIYFQTVVPGDYNESTGDYGEPTVTEVKRLASVQQANFQPKGEYRLKLLYGSIKENSLTVSLLNAYTKPFDRIRIGDKLFQVDARLPHRSKQVFIVSQIQTSKKQAQEPQTSDDQSEDMTEG